MTRIRRLLRAANPHVTTGPRPAGSRGRSGKVLREQGSSRISANTCGRPPEGPGISRRRGAAGRAKSVPARDRKQKVGLAAAAMGLEGPFKQVCEVEVWHRPVWNLAREPPSTFGGNRRAIK